MASRSSDSEPRSKKRAVAADARRSAPVAVNGHANIAPAPRSRVSTPRHGTLQNSLPSAPQVSAQLRPLGPPAGDWTQPDVTAPNALRELPVRPLVPTLCILSSNVYAGVELLVDRTLRIGRDPDNDIRLPGDVSMSRHHAVFTPTSDCLFIEDLRSTNGTLVNGALVQRAPLNHNDRVRIGDTLFQVRYEPLRGLSQRTPPPATVPNQQDGTGAALRTWRRGKGLTQTDLAGQLGVSQRTVSLWEQGAPISPDNLRNLREKAGCDVL
jgi:DNA-binding XRE family transcriptional regulator